MNAYNNRMNYISFILIFAISLLWISSIYAQHQYFNLMDRTYCFEGGKWYTYFQGSIGDEIIPHRIVVRLIDRGNMKAFDFGGISQPGAMK
jgi:hypothetical protein